MKKPPHARLLSRDRIDGLLLDLDGVITATAGVHATSWKRLFDEYLQAIADRDGTPFVPFTDDDYRLYVDGKPRFEGIRSFLESRTISIPFGTPEDGPELETICGLGNLKNGYFNESLARDGVTVYDDAVGAVRGLRKEGYRLAVVSSSKNGRPVLDVAGITDLFDVIFDGTDAAEAGLRGKPEPDTYLEAARRLEVRPERAAVFEDAISGIEAGRAGRFGVVVGVDRTGHGQGLIEAGADFLLSDFGDLMTADAGRGPETGDIPSALERLDDLVQDMKKKRLAVFLDYDGTLTPIVDRPELAILSQPMREVVRRLSEVQLVAVVSGRDLEDVRNLVEIDTIIFAGAHGFDISSPDGGEIRHEMGTSFGPLFEHMAKRLHGELDGVDGALIEEKKSSIAVHYRLVAEANVKTVKAVVDKEIENDDTLRLMMGKKVFEIQPRIDWDKGKAVDWLLKALELDEAHTLPIYLGDDVTDEDAFRALKGRGIGIQVFDPSGEHASRQTIADYRLKNPDEVGQFLQALSDASLQNET